MRNLLLILLLIYSNPILADQETCSPVIHLGSFHSKWHYKLNEVNYGAGLHCEKGVHFGMYRNSNYTDTLYVGTEYQLTKYMGVKYGFATGYLLPVYAVGYIRYKFVELMLIPPTKINPATLGYSIQF